MNIGEKIKHLRKKCGLTQTELGQKLGVKTNAVSKWECGRVEMIPTSKIKAMAAIFGVLPSYLIDDEQTRLPGPLSPLPPMRPWEVVGATACGEPVHREIYDYTVLAPEDIHADAVFRCDGDSMTGARIFDGDYVFIKFNVDADNGGIYLVRIGDEYTLKRVYQSPGELRLVPDNPAHATRVIAGSDLDGVEIVGKAVYLMGAVK